MTVGVAVLGSGNIGTDLMIKVLRLSESLHLVAMAGIDPASDDLARARRLGVATTAEGMDGLVAMPEFADVAQGVQFDRVDTYVPVLGRHVAGLQVSVFLEVSGAGHYLPAYAGNLDIMTAAALRTAERLVALGKTVAA